MGVFLIYIYLFLIKFIISKGGLDAGADPGEKNKGAKHHTHRKKRIKIGQPRSKIQAKTYPKHTLNTLKFSKQNSCEVGLMGHKGKYFVHKSNIKVILLIVSLLSSNI